MEADGDRGSSAVEMVIIFPVTLFVVLGIVQFGLWYHADAIARAAAQQGAKAASAYGAEPGQGTAAADQVLAQNGHGLIHDPAVVPADAGASVRVTVTGRALEIVPLIHLPVRATAQVPVEAYHAPGAP